MDTLIKSDVFFFITSIGVVLLVALLTVVLIYAIRIFKDLKYVSRRAKEEADLLAMDIDAARAKIKEEGYKAAGIMDYVLSFFPKKARKHTTKK